MKPGKKKNLFKFEQFANSLLPHEAKYLIHIHRLNDPEKIEILNHIEFNSKQIFHQVQYNEAIDKRKYSHLLSWIKDKLLHADADVFYQWLTSLDLKIMTDSITADDEIQLMKTIRNYRYPNYYFIRFYELVQNFRNFLLIRMRYNYYEITGRFLDNYREKYQNAKNVNQKLHEATSDIVSQYSLNNIESRQWEDWLISVFNDDQLDGLNRYFAIVRLTFLYYNYKEYGKLIELYGRLDEMIVEGKIYSRRILVNYYANRVLLHSRYNELEEAEKYGYLSVRHKGADYLYYVNNLCAVLLRNNKNSDALNLMQANSSNLKTTISPHTRIGFVSYYIQCMNRNGKARQALEYAESFLSSNKSEILKYRWHIFFISMIQSMLLLENYRKSLTLIRRNKLDILELEYRKRAGYIPVLVWYYTLARYKELEITEEQLIHTFVTSAQVCLSDNHKKRRLVELADELRLHAPGLILKVIKALEISSK